MKWAHLAATAIVAVGCSASAPASLDEITEVAGFQRAVRPDTTEMRSRMQATIDAFDGGAALWVSIPGDPEPLFARNADQVVIAASIYKLAVMVHVESLIEQRKLKPTDVLTIADEDVTADFSYVLPGAEVPIDEALELMITLSDNGTALAFLRVHGAGAINATLERYRIPGVRIGEPGEDSFATARGAGVLLARIAERRLVSRAASERMLARLGRQEIGGRLDALLPPGARIAHKTGDLPGLAHDAGIVFTPAGPRVVVVMTWDASQDSAHALMARIGKAVYETAR